MASRLYELLKARDDAESADTQREILRHLQNTHVPESERAGLDALKRLHLEHLCTYVAWSDNSDEVAAHSDDDGLTVFITVRLQQREKNEKEERVSERRSQWRAECRTRWQQDASAKSVSLEAIQQRYSGLFQDKVCCSGCMCVCLYLVMVN